MSFIDAKFCKELKNEAAETKTSHFGRSPTGMSSNYKANLKEGIHNDIDQDIAVVDQRFWEVAVFRLHVT